MKGRESEKHVTQRDGEPPPRTKVSQGVTENDTLCTDLDSPMNNFHLDTGGQKLGIRFLHTFLTGGEVCLKTHCMLPDLLK